MANELSPEAHGRITDYCRQIAIAHQLDDEIQRELAGHLEDKMLAYLGGQEPLTEDDVFILASRRLGELAHLKELLGRVHAGEAAVSLGRKVLAIIIVQTLLGYGIKLAAALLILVVGWLLSAPAGSLARMEYALYGNPFYLFGQTLGALWLMVWLLRRWKRQLSALAAPWFIRWPVWLLTLMAIGALALTPLADLLKGLYATPPWSPSSPVYAWNIIGIWIVLIITTIANAVLWLWWCDSRPRRKGAMLQAGLWFSAWCCIESLMHNFIKLHPDYKMNYFPHEIMRAHGWIFTWSYPGVAQMLFFVILLIIALILAFLGWRIYEFILWKMARNAAIKMTDPPVSQ